MLQYPGVGQGEQVCGDEHVGVVERGRVAQLAVVVLVGALDFDRVERSFGAVVPPDGHGDVTDAKTFGRCVRHCVYSCLLLHAPAKRITSVRDVEHRLSGRVKYQSSLLYIYAYDITTVVQ